MRPGRLEVSGLRWMGSGQWSGLHSCLLLYCMEDARRRTQHAAARSSTQHFLDSRDSPKSDERVIQELAPRVIC